MHIIIPMQNTDVYKVYVHQFTSVFCNDKQKQIKQSFVMQDANCICYCTKAGLIEYYISRIERNIGQIFWRAKVTTISYFTGHT